MAKAINTFLKSKMNKDLDARILPSGEYRDAQNVQVSRSEGDTVGSLENVLGVSSIKNFESITGISNLECIGYLADDVNNNIYLFFTNYTDPQPENLKYSPNAENFIFQYNTLNDKHILLVQGAFLNFSKTHPIYGINIIEGLLFWTDNRNQPRKINTTLANPNELPNPTYYTTEDQISVAKYNPHASIELWQQSQLSTSVTPKYETTMKDVTSKYLPNGGTGNADGAQTGTSINVDSVIGYIYEAGEEYGADGSKIYIVEADGSVTDTGETVVSYTYTGSTGIFTLTVSNSITVDDDQEVIFNANPYYNNTFAGDPDFLEDKFVRFSYRFKFDDNEYSIMAPYTQNTFIPKQDGYFMYIDNNDFEEVNDQSDTYRSTIVSFMENKVNDIDLRIPLPFANYELRDKLKIKEIEVLYKQSDQVSAKVVDVINMDSVYNSSAICYVDGNTSSSTDIVIDGLQGGIQPGALVSGTNVVAGTVVESYNESTKTITVDTAQSLIDDTELTIGDPDYYVYNYQSKKPYKTLPENEITRVYDKVPVRSLGQEISGNRVIYANYQDKHTPPSALNYNVACTEKADFGINDGRADVFGNFNDVSTIVIDGVKGQTIDIGSYVVLETGSGNVPDNTQIIAISEDTPGPGQWTIVLTNNVTLNNNEILIFLPGGDVTNTTSAIEYPNHSVKTNRNYQIGVVLSDRYGRQSTVILSNNTDTITVGAQSYAGSTLYHPYFNQSLSQDEWRGDSLKMLFNDPISPIEKNIPQGWPGVYNGDITSENYNPLGWFSYKIVVKQNEQEYYNVYLPGIMAAYPKDTTKELNKTSHVVLINDNINKVPRDLTQVGPDQKQYRSSVRLFGRVENTDGGVSPDYGNFNSQYYPGRTSDTASSISTMQELFEYDPLDAPRPNYFPQFYSYDSNPLIGRISTKSKIGSIASTNYNTGSGLTNAAVNNDVTFDIKNVNGTIIPGQIVVGNGIPEGVTVVSFTAGTPPTLDSIELSEEVTLPEDRLLTFNQTEDPGIQYLAVYETEPFQSLLDIFWETSTSGLVNELNDAVLNGSQGAADLSSFNVDDWDESYQVGDEILSADIYLIDNFGQTIPDADIQTPLYLESVVDLSDPQFPQDRTNFFNFINKTTDYIHNIEITQEYYDEIFYGYDANVRTFIFTFKAVVNEVETTFVKIEGPGNVDPIFDNCPVGNLDIPRSSYEMITFQGVNGADNVNLRNLDLEYSISSVVGAELGDVTDLNYFSIINQQQNGTFFDGTLVNNLHDDPTMPIDVYTINVKLSDAAGEAIGSTDCPIVFSSGVVPASVRSYTYGKLCQGESVKDYWDFVVIEIDSLGPSRNGFYLTTKGYGVGFENPEAGWLNYLNFYGGDILPVNYTDASTVDGPCTSWWYSPTSRQAVIDLFIENCTCEGNVDDSIEFTSINIDDYTFYMK